MTMIEKVTALRHALHQIPEISGQEVRTKALLKQFLTENTTLELHDCGEGFYAAHREGAALPGVALRADYDALAMPDGTANHLCGHDGHAAALCGVALSLEGRTVGKNVYLLFQPAEETGAGAAKCCALFDMEHVDEIYGAHNLPGWPRNQVVTKPGTFACASRGVTLRFTGKPTHAAYPELGVSPAPAVGQLLTTLPVLADPARYTGMTLCTVIGVQMGEKAFGAAAAQAEVWLTLRGEHDADLHKLYHDVLVAAATLAQQTGVEFSGDVQDVFPSTENDPDCAARVMACCSGASLAQPMRWSEDFGHYLQKVKGAFFGIGAGEDWPGLHTENYEYPDEILPATVQAFMNLLEAQA